MNNWQSEKFSFRFFQALCLINAHLTQNTAGPKLSPVKTQYPPPLKLKAERFLTAPPRRPLAKAGKTRVHHPYIFKVKNFLKNIQVFLILIIKSKVEHTFLASVYSTSQNGIILLLLCTAVSDNTNGSTGKNQPLSYFIFAGQRWGLCMPSACCYLLIFEHLSSATLMFS